MPLCRVHKKTTDSPERSIRHPRSRFRCSPPSPFPTSLEAHAHGSRLLGCDASRAASGAHAVGGLAGAPLTGMFSAPALGGFGAATGVPAQAGGVGFTIAYTTAVTWRLRKLARPAIRLPVDEEQEAEGLDLALHDEHGYNP